MFELYDGKTSTSRSNADQPCVTTEGLITDGWAKVSLLIACRNFVFFIFIFSDDRLCLTLIWKRHWVNQNSLNGFVW